MRRHHPKSNSPTSQATSSKQALSSPYVTRTTINGSSHSTSRFKLPPSGSARFRPDTGISPETAAMVVRQHLLPLFESDSRPKQHFADFKKPLEVVKNTVYGELKLADALLTEYTEAKDELDVVSQQLKDSEQEKESVSSELEHLKRQYSGIMSEIDSLQLEVQNSLRAQQYSELKDSFIQNQLLEYKRLYTISEAENKEFLSALHEEKALNDKRKNISVELEHGNELLKMENDIMAERLSGLYAEFQTLSQRHFLENKSTSESEVLAVSLAQLAVFCQSLSRQLEDAHSEREHLKSQYDEIQSLTQEIKSFHDVLMGRSKEAIATLQWELSSMIEQREEYKTKQSQLEKNYKDLADAYEQLRNRLKQWKARGRNFKESEEKICSKCRQPYAEHQNYNWSCRTHAGTYSVPSNLWWCCGKLGKDAPGCVPSKHITKDEDEELDPTKQDAQFGTICSSCKELGHSSHECLKDPNIRSAAPDLVEDDERIREMRKRKKAKSNKAEVNAQVMGMLEDLIGAHPFVEDTGNNEVQCEFGDIQAMKSATKQRKRTRFLIESVEEEP